MTLQPAGSRPAPRRRDVLLRAAWLVYLGVLAWLLLTPSSGDAIAGVEFISTTLSMLLNAEVTGRAVEFLLNALIFVPLPALGLAASRRWTAWDWTAVGLLLSVGVETMQGVFLPGRSAELVDLVANALGAALGALSAHILIGREGSRAVLRGPGQP